MLTFDEPGLVTLVSTHLDLDPARLTPGALLAEDLAVDSLAAIELVMMLEDSYGIEIGDEVIGDVHSWGDLLTLIRRQVAGRAAPCR